MGHTIHRWRGRLGALAIILSLGLGGCFQADLTLRFDHQTHGEIIQSIQLGQRGMALAQTTLQPWVADLRPAIQTLGGHLEQTEDTIAWVVPFSTATDLVERFNQVFAAAEDDQSSFPDPRPRLRVPGLGDIPYQLALDQAAWLWVSRTHLSYDLDLRSLAPANAPGDGRSSPALGFRLETPWGLSQVAPASATPTRQGPTATFWQLDLGQLHHIEVWFWLPNLVALGSVAVGMAVLLGYILRYRVLGPPGRPT